MIRRSLSLSIISLLFCFGHTASAQVLQVIGCDVERAGPFAATVNNVWEALSDGYRPTVTLIANAINGNNKETHAVLLNHPDYERYEAWGARLAQSTDVQLIFERSDGNSECDTQLLVIERASWGDSDADWAWNAVFPVTTSDAAGYLEAFDKMMNSETGESIVGGVMLYEARAGGTNTHVVAVLAPSFAALNRNLDTLFSSDDYADFVDAVGGSRVLGPRSQNRHVRTWEP